MKSGKTVLEIETGLRNMQAIICSPDTTIFAIRGYTANSDSEGKFLNIWDVNTGKLVAELEGDTGRVDCLVWTADGTTLISGSFDYSIRTWNIVTWEQIKVLMGHTYSVEVFTISLNRRVLASASIDMDRTTTSEGYDGDPLQHDHRNSLESGVTSTGSEILGV